MFFGEGRPGALYEEGDDVQEVAALFVGPALALVARAALDYLQDVQQLVLAAEVLAYGAYLLDEGTGQVAGRDGDLLACVVEGGVHAVARGAHLVLYGQLAVVGALRARLLQRAGHDALGQGSQGDRWFKVRLGVGDAELYGAYLRVGTHIPPAEGVVVHGSGLNHEVHVVLERFVVGEGGGHPRAGEGLEDLHPGRLVARVHPLPVGGVGRERQQERRVLREAVVGPDALVGTGDGHVDVLAEDHLPLGDPAQGLYDLLVALLVGNLLVAVAGEGVGAGGCQRGVAGGGPGGDPAPQLAQVPLGLGRTLAHGRLDLQDRLEELVGDELGQVVGEAGHDLLDLRGQLRGRGVDDVELLLDP